MSRRCVLQMWRADAAGFSWKPVLRGATVTNVIAGGTTLPPSAYWVNGDRLELVEPAPQVWAVLEI